MVHVIAQLGEACIHECHTVLYCSPLLRVSPPNAFVQAVWCVVADYTTQDVEMAQTHADDAL